MNHLTDICRIGLVKRSGSEYSTYTKEITLTQKPDFATVRLDSQGICGIFVNGDFVEASCGRYPNRITYVEIGGKLKAGKNEIRLELGNHYFQSTLRTLFERSHAMFSAVAAEITAQSQGETLRVVTDRTWRCVSDGAETAAQVFSQVTKAEYERFWQNAVLWREQKAIEIPAAVAAVAGEAYSAYAATYPAEYLPFTDAAQTNMKKTTDGILTKTGDGGFALYDLGRLYVGYLEVVYEADADGEMTLMFDATESPQDFEHDHATRQRLQITEKIHRGGDRIFLLRRRAFRYMKLLLSGEGTVQIQSVRLRLSMMPFTQVGWFRCDDAMLNRIWEVGKYTLWVNKHVEYESCPRNEMKYFSGDGIIEALADYYAFGEPDLTNASLSLTEIDNNVGIRHDRCNRSTGLYDYPAWRILMTYDHYRYFADTALVRRYYEELKENLIWMLDKTNTDYLIYQFPCFAPPFYVGSSPVEYNSSPDRLGEKPLLNALLYRSLVCMSEFAAIVHDEDGREWAEIAGKVRQAINDHLWDEERGAYLDLFDRSYIPQDGNAVTVNYGAAPIERAKRALDTVRRENWSMQGSSIVSTPFPLIRDRERTISPVMNMHEAEARFKCGDAEGAIELIRRCWGTMIRKGAETFWEFAPDHATDLWPHRAHGWASGCTYLLSAYGLGIRPKKPGYEEITFAPCGGIGNAAGVVPTCKGLIAVRCENTPNGKRYRLAMPKGCKLNIKIGVKDEITVEEY